MSIDEYVEEAEKLEKKYMEAICSLDPIDKTIMLESLINGEPYWKIGLKLGYTEEAVRKRKDRIIRKMALSMSDEATAV